MLRQQEKTVKTCRNKTRTKPASKGATPDDAEAWNTEFTFRDDDGNAASWSWSLDSARRLVNASEAAAVRYYAVGHALVLRVSSGVGVPVDVGSRAQLCVVHVRCVG